MNVKIFVELLNKHIKKIIDKDKNIKKKYNLRRWDRFQKY